jgi:acyl-CoA synthetase (NDP forming)
MKVISDDIISFFNPQSLAIVGASRNFRKWGAIILHNTLLGGYQGRIYPVNPGEKDIFNVPVYPRLSDIPEIVDLVVIVVPAQNVMSVLEEVQQLGIRACVVITAGFSETGESGRKLEQEIGLFARRHGIRLMGPNCMGLISMIPQRLTVLMPAIVPEPGPVSIISQSGNVGYSLVRALTRRGLGICRSISSGNEADLSTVDFLHYLGEDPETELIISYIEGVDDGRALLDTLKRVNRKKPVVVLKSGSTGAGASASASHTGSMTGREDVYHAAFWQTGALRARGIEEVEDFATVLCAQPRPTGRRVGVLTLGGGWGVLAADALERAGLEVVPLSSETVATLDTLLPPWWSKGNPVDTVAGMKEGALFECLKTLLACEYIDSVMLLGVGYGTVRGSAIKDSPYSDLYDMRKLGEIFIKADEEMARGIAELMNTFQKPIVPVVDQGIIDQRGSFVEALQENGILLLPSPLRGANALAALTRYGEYLSRI